jgi:hypothetical protein
MLGRMRRGRVWRFALGLGATLAFAVGSGCGDDERPPTFTAPRDDAGNSSAGDAGVDIDIGEPEICPDLDAGTVYCGTEVIPVDVERLNLYFVIDSSGSMDQPIVGTPLTRYKAAFVAAVELLRKIGHRVHYGAALSPGPLEADACEAGEEVFETVAGDPSCFAKSGEDGPVLTSFRRRLAGIHPEGGTPTAATLEALRPKLVGLEGETVVILATDGAPNCNGDEMCDVDSCIPNIEGLSLDTPDGVVACDGDFNCCDPNVVEDAGYNCIDDTRTEDAVAALSDEGVPTYVIGLPGSEAYAELLGTLARAGGTARGDDVDYFPTEDTDALNEALLEIGLEVTVSCEQTLDREPAHADQVNVYFDDDLVEYDEANGWSWVDEQTIALNGEACDTLKSGDILSVQVVGGCDTVIR